MGNRLPNLLERIWAEEFVVSIQLDPPISSHFTPFADMVKELMKHGVDTVDINSSRRTSYDSLQLAAELARWGLEVIPHVTTRDSSMNGLVNQLLAAHSISRVRHALVITGDPYEGSRPAMVESRGVFQTDSVGALELFRTHFKESQKAILDFTFAAAVEEYLPRDSDRMKAKIAAGAEFFMSQPVFNVEDAKQFMKEYRRASSAPVLVGIWPLTSWKTVEAIYNGRIPGVLISANDHAYAEGLKDDEEKLAEWGFEQAEKVVKFLREHTKADGVYIVAPSRNPLTVLKLFKKIKNL